METKNFVKAGASWKLAFAVAALTLGIGTTANAQCPQQANSCQNQVVPKNPNTPYQMAGEASRINGGPRLMNKVEKVLLYDNVPNTNHNQGKDAIRRMMVGMANKYGFELVIDDGALGWITAERLQGVDVVLLSQGDRDVLGNSATSPSTIAMENFIYREGGALLMLHAASAFITCPGTGTNGGGENIHDPSCRFLARATARQYYHHQNAGTQMRVYVDSTLPGQLPPYGSLGGTGDLGPVPKVAVIPHGRMSPETKNIFDNEVPFNAPLPPNSPSDPRTYVWDNFADEWYNYSSSPRTIDTTMIRNVTNFTPAELHIEGKVNVLLALDEMSRNIGSQRMGDHPMSWTRRMGAGLAAYSNIGHNNAPFGERTGDGRSGVDSVAHKYTWNLIRYLGRDYEGCTEANFAEYNPHASVDNITGYEDINKPAIASIMPEQPDPCVTPTAILPGSSFGKIDGVTVTSRANGITLELPREGRYRVMISDLNGRYVFSGGVSGGAGRTLDVPNLVSGHYIIRVKAPGSRGFDVARVRL